VLFLLTGSAGAGKSAALKELATRHTGLALLDLDDLRPPSKADASWWQKQIEAQVRRAVEEEVAGRDTLLAGWTTIEGVLAAPSSALLGGIAACLLDCDDQVRIQRVEQRAASGMWRAHTDEELDGFLRAATEMCRGSSAGLFHLDTSGLSVSEVADRLEAWIAEQRRQRHG